MEPITIYLETDSVITLTLTDSGTPVTTATVTLSIEDRAGDAVGSELTFTHDGDGVYSCSVPYDFGLEEDRYSGWFSIQNNGTRALGRRAIVGEYRAI